MAQPRNITIDARLAGSRHAGIGRYEAEIIRRLVSEPRFLDEKFQVPVHWHIWVSADDDVSWLPKNLSHGFTLRQTSIRHYGVAEQLFWPQQLAQYPSDLIWVPHFNVPLRCPFPWVVTLHDLLWHQIKDPRATTLSPWKHAIKHHGYRWVTSHAARGADAIIVPSKAVAEDVHKLLGADLPVTVTYEGVTASYLEAKISPEAGLPHIPKIVYIGSLYPHKNVNIILQALRALPEFEFHVVSARSIFTDELIAEAERLGVREQLHVRGYLDDLEVRELLQNSVALIQPSTSEGFGLTGLEGLAAGVPVVASDLPVFAELYQDFATFFPRHDAIELSQVLKKLWKNPLSVAERTRAQNYARGFTWDKTTEMTWEVIQKTWRKRYGHLQ